MGSIMLHRVPHQRIFAVSFARGMRLLSTFAHADTSRSLFIASSIPEIRSSEISIPRQSQAPFKVPYKLLAVREGYLFFRSRLIVSSAEFVCTTFVSGNTS